MPAQVSLRMQHYQFAARALPTILFRQPRSVLELLSGPDGDRFLADIWTRTGEQYGTEACAGLAPPTASLLDGDGGYRALVVTLPPPENATEAHFVAIAFPADAGPPFTSDPTPRYFALERTGFGDDPPSTLLCEWTRDGSHINHGPGPTPSTAGLLAALADPFGGR